MVEFYVEPNTTTIPLGRQGENLARTIYFELSEMIEEYGAGTATLICLRSKDSAPYVCDTTQTGSMLSWTPTDTDTAYAGAGKCELRWVVGDVLAKSIVYRTSVAESITGDSTVPSEYESWYDALLEQISEYAIASEQITQNSTEIAALDSRMDTFTSLSEGSTTGDAELADGRVGYDGTTYANIGDAIRDQVSDIHIEIGDLSDLDTSVQTDIVSAINDVVSGSASKWGSYSGTLVPNAYINHNAGAIISGTDINYAEFPVSEGVIVLYNYTVESPGTYGIAFYDSNDNYITAYQTGTAAQELTAPAGTVLCRATVSALSDIAVVCYNRWVHDVAVEVEAKIDKNSHTAGTNYINPNSVGLGYVNSSGEISITGTWHNTGYIEFEDDTPYYYSGLYSGASGYYAFYDEDKNVVEVGTSALPNPFTLPDGARYGRFSKNTDITSSVWISTANSAPSAYSESPTLENYLKKNQGASNAGSLLMVGNDGDIGVNGDIVATVHDPSTNYINLDNIEAGFINGSGNAQSSSNWHNSGYVELEPGASYYWSGLYGSSAGYYAFYDSSKAVVSVGTSALPNPFTVPSGAVYGRFSKNSATWTGVWIYTENNAPADYATMLDSSIFLRKNQGATNAGKVLVVGSDGTIAPATADDAEYCEAELWKRGNLYKESELVEGKYIYKTGNESSYSGYYCTPYLPVSGEYVYVQGFLKTYYAFYDASKLLIASYDTLGNMEQWTPGIKRVAIPSGAVYGRFSANGLPDSYNFITCEAENPLPEDQKNVKEVYPYTFNPDNPCDCETGSVSVFHKGVCIGDSLTWGTFNVDDGATTNIPSATTLHEWYSYPTYFTKITGVETTNMGDASETFKTWYEAYGQTDFSGHDFAIIHLGVNDASFGVSDEETAQYLCAIVDALKASVTGIKVFVCTVTPVFSNDRFPTHKQKSVVIRQTIAANYADDPDVVLLDIEQYSYVRQYTSFAAGHFTALGYWRFAKDVANYISWHIDRHMRDYRFVHYIGSDRTYSGD